MPRSYPTLLLFILSAILLLAIPKPSLAAPTSLLSRSESSLYPRKGPSDKSVTIATSETQDSPNGPVIINCVITLTPITLKNGDEAFEEVKKCQTIAAADTGAATGSSSSASETATASETSAPAPETSAPPAETSTKAAETAAPSPATSTDSASDSATTTSSEPPATTGAVQPATTLILTSESVTATDTPTPTPTSTSVKSTTESPAISVNGASTVASTAVPTAAPSPAVVTPSPSASASALPVTTSSSSAASTGTAAASEQGNGATSLPGKKLSVLPIGLGVFAGISVIALIVVGLVTYERTKYRKAFRQRKLAEAGAAMGYGGMNGMV